MPGRGRQPKDPARSQRHGEKNHRETKRQARTLVGVPTGRIEREVPPAARDWLPEIRKEWRELWRSDLADAFELTDVPALRRLFKIKTDRETCQKVVDEVGYLTQGSQKQIVLNPLLRKIGDYDEKITALEDRFGLNPRARLALGFTFAEAHMSLERMNQMFADVVERAEDEEDPRKPLELADPRKP